jgi:hypothetical protein
MLPACGFLGHPCPSRARSPQSGTGKTRQIGVRRLGLISRPGKKGIAIATQLVSTFPLVDSSDHSFTVSRTHLVYALTLPLAALLGFMLAEPLGSNLFIILMVLGALVFPLFMRWYHPLVIFSWNATLIFSLLPGQPPWWMVFTAIGFLVVILNTCIGSRSSRITMDSVAISLLILGAVVFITSMFTGGAGIRSLGGETYGGKRYVYVYGAILGYFVLASRSIPRERAVFCVAVFFLAGGTSFLTDLAGMYLPQLSYVVPMGGDPMLVRVFGGVVRFGGLVGLSTALCLVLMARYGLAGLLDPKRPLRIVLFLAGFAMGMLGGFRSYVIAMAILFTILFLLEGLHRTKLIIGVMVVLVLGAAGLVAFSTHLPMSVQRALSFLPIQVDPTARMDAEGSTEWRMEMWRSVAPEVEKYILFGKGFGIRPDDIYMSGLNSYLGYGIAAEGAEASGDYHNGPLSLIIPFGVWGGLAFAGFIVASVRMLRRFCQYGDPALRQLNQVLLAYFLTRAFGFFFIFGSFYNDLAALVGLIGLAVALNGPLSHVEQPEEAQQLEGALP